MKLIKAIIASYKYSKEIYGKDNSEEITHHMAIYRKEYPKYVFYYVPEYSEITEEFDLSNKNTWKTLDLNCWRHGLGTFGELIIPESWLDKDDWKICKV